MDTVTVVVKSTRVAHDGFAYGSLTATVQVAAGDDALWMAREEFVAQRPELRPCNWDLRRMVPTGPSTFTMTVTPVGRTW